MDTSTPLIRPNQQILDEAAAWFVDFREGDVDEARRKAFNAWIRLSPQHISAYLEVAALWADVPDALPAGTLDVEALIAFANEERNVVTFDGQAPAKTSTARRGGGGIDTDDGTRVPHRRWKLAASMAASVLMIAVAGTLTWRHLNGETYTTEIGEQRSVVLDDGSTVQLNAKSRVRVRFSERARELELVAGQALFRVAKDAARPFTVAAGATHVRAVGTQFDVYRKTNSTIVTVIEGRVAVVASPSGPSSSDLDSRTEPAAPRTSHTRDVYVTAGEQLTVTPETPAPAQPNQADLAATMAWTRREFVFRGTPLSEVVAEFNRYNKHQIVLRDAELRAIRVGGTFSSTDPATLVSFLREQLGLTVSERDGSIQISRD